MERNKTKQTKIKRVTKKKGSQTKLHVSLISLASHISYTVAKLAILYPKLVYSWNKIYDIFQKTVVYKIYFIG